MEELQTSYIGRARLPRIQEVNFKTPAEPSRPAVVQIIIRGRLYFVSTPGTTGSLGPALDSVASAGTSWVGRDCSRVR